MKYVKNLLEIKFVDISEGGFSADQLAALFLNDSQLFSKVTPQDMVYFLQSLALKDTMRAQRAVLSLRRSDKLEEGTMRVRS